jgi:hypothetical protein
MERAESMSHETRKKALFDEIGQHFVAFELIKSKALFHIAPESFQNKDQFTIEKW